jgi:catechol 2,3-dioxygenase-like lactoylglutathione lyase family enzyme
VRHSGPIDQSPSSHGAGATPRRAKLAVVDLNHLNLRVRDAPACRRFYERHFGFRLAFEAEGGFFLRNAERFLLALVPVDDHAPLPAGFHIGFGLDTADEVMALYVELAAAGAVTTALQDHRPQEAYVTFRCGDPDGTEIEVFWEPAEARPADGPARDEAHPGTALMPRR